MSDLYEPYLMSRGKSVLGEQDDWRKTTKEHFPDMPLFKAFLEDDDIQQIQYISTNLMLIRSWQKVYKK